MLDSNCKKRRGFLQRALRFMDKYEKLLRIVAAVLIAAIYVVYGHGMITKAARDDTNQLFSAQIVGGKSLSDLMAPPAPKPVAPQAPINPNQQSPQNGQKGTTASSQNTSAPPSSQWPQITPLVALPVYFVHIAIPVAFVLIVLLAILGGGKNNSDEAQKNSKGLGWFWLAGVVGIAIPFLFFAVWQ